VAAEPSLPENVSIAPEKNCSSAIHLIVEKMQKNYFLHKEFSNCQKNPSPDAGHQLLKRL